MVTTKTTSRRKKKPTKPKKAPVKPQRLEKLTETDFRMVEVLSRDVQNSKLLVGLEEQSLRNLLLEHKLMENSIDKQKIRAQSMAQNYETSKKRYSTRMQELHTKYEIGEGKGLAYNPDNGDLVRD